MIIWSFAQNIGMVILGNAMAGMGIYPYENYFLDYKY